MKSLGNFLRQLTPVLLLTALLCVSVPTLHAQTVSVSPGDLSFGIPSGTVPPLSSTSVVTVNITGSGTVTLSGFLVTGTNSTDFVIHGNTCTTAQTAPTTCQIGIMFTSTQAAGVLETATLTFASTAQPATLSVPMNGALGAIKLFGPLNVNPSLFSGITWPNSPGNPDQTITLNISCPAPPVQITGTLSSTPDGSGNVFQDNTIAVTDTPVNSDPIPTTNVCYGGDPNFEGFTGFPAGTSNCFQQSYESAAQGQIGNNPDITPGFVPTYGVQPLNLMAALPPGAEGAVYPPVLQPGMQSLSVQMLDAGGDLGSATLHLVTNCTVAGVTPGGTVTGNPITPGNTQSQTQTATFDSNPGQNISLTTSVAANPTIIPSGTVQRTIDIAIPQQLFSQLVAFTSAAPAVCLRLSGELDSFGQSMCKGFLAQCSLNGGPFTGDNCVPTASTARDLLDVAQFDSPDAPSGVNFLSSACANALGGSGSCASTVLTGTSPMLIGPGILLGSDNWTCAPGDTTPCTPQVASTHTTGTIYSSLNCKLTGSVDGDLCPLDTLTLFTGAADPSHGGTTTGKNSIYIPVVNMPLPFTAASITNQSNSWVNNDTADLSFVANQANYTPANTNPPSNNFTPAPPYSVTYGVTPFGANLPDTTYPVPGDLPLYNTNTFQNFQTPLCGNGGPTPGVSPALTAQLTVAGEGMYNLHYFATDCALTEELLFSPQGTQLTDPTANWASFRFITFGVDTSAPVLACTFAPSTANGTNGWYKQDVVENCTATDQNYVAGSTGSGFLPIVKGIQGSQTENTGPFSTAGQTPGTATLVAQQVKDLAGNPSNTVLAPTFSVDEVAPTVKYTFSVPGNTFTVGQPVNILYTCTDVGSGLANCASQLVPTGCPTAPAVGAPTYTFSSAVDTSAGAVGPHTFTVTATDCAGNISGSQTVSYSVAAPAADTAIGEVDTSDYVRRGGKVTFLAYVVDLSSPTAYGVNYNATINFPAGTLGGTITANVQNISCTIHGCTFSTTPCTTTSSTVSCNIGQLASLLKGSVAIVNLTVPVSPTATLGSVFTINSTVTSDNDPNLKNNTNTELITVTK